MAYFSPSHDVLSQRKKFLYHSSKANFRELEKRFRLIKAIRDYNRNEALESIESGVEINLVDQQGRSALTYAVIFNDSDVVQALIKAGADVNVSDYYGKTPLFYCVAEESLYARRNVSRLRTIEIGVQEREIKVTDLHRGDVASSLIKAGANVNMTDHEGKTPLMHALQNNEALVFALIDAGADFKVIDKNGRTALHYASINGNENIVSQLTNSIDINSTDNEGKTALMLALQHGQRSLAAKLIDAGANVNVVDKKGRTALFYDLAEKTRREHQNSHKIVSMLIKAGADLNTADNQGKTALMIAVQNGLTSVVAKLLDNGANVNVVDKEGRTALIYSALLYQVMDNSKENILHMLIRAGAELNNTDYFGKTALIYCAQQGKGGIHGGSFYPSYLYESKHKGDENGYSTLALELIKAGANLNVTDNDGKTALMYSLRNKSKVLACALIEFGADVNVIDKEGRTALIYWAMEYTESMEYIDDDDYYEDDYYDDDDYDDNDYYYPKIDAADYETVASLLVKAGADINISDNKGKNALVHSLHSKNHTLACTLIEAGADVNIVDKKGTTILMHLAQSSQMKMKMCDGEDKENEDAKNLASMIIKDITDLNVTDKDGKTALIYSIQHNDKNLTSKLIDTGADVNVVDHTGKTALFYATIYGFRSLMSKFPTHAYDSSSPGNQVETSFVNLCYNERELFTKLINAGANVDLSDLEQKTALMYFAENRYDWEFYLFKAQKQLPDPLSKYVGQVDLNYNNVAYALMTASGDLNKVDNQGKTALMYFLQHKKDFAAMTLIDCGADANIVDDDGKTALFYASRTCSNTFINKLVNISSDINIADNQGVTALMYALQNNEYLALALIGAGADVKIADNSGRNALHYASINGNENIVSQLTNSIDINSTDNEGKTALMLALQHGQTSLASKFIDAGADVNVVDKEGKTALFYGAFDDLERRELQIFKYWCMPTTFLGPEDDIAKNRCKNVSMLIQADADLNKADNEGKTALIYAVQDNNKSLALELLDAGADVNIADNDGRTAILYAISCKNERLIQALIEAGANANITDVHGKTALIHLAQDGVSRKGHNLHDSLVLAESEGLRYMLDGSPRKIEIINYKKVASLLIGAGAKINVTDIKGKTALIYSLETNKENLACTLIDAGADVKMVDKSGRTALFYALFTGSEIVASKVKRTSFGTITGISDSEEDSIVLPTNAPESRESTITRLIEAGADVSTTYTRGKTALIYAVEKDDESLARALIKAGADINVSDEKGKTALIYSVQNNNEDMVSLLIEAGADANIVDHDSKTALFYGVHNENIVHLLVNNGKASINKRDKFSRSPLFYAMLESLTSARYLLQKGCGLHRNDCYNINILSFFIEHSLRQGYDHCYISDGLQLLQEKGIKQENIFEALINSVFCMILFTTLELQGRKKIGFLSQKPNLKEVIWVLNLSREYVSEGDDKKCETIQNTIMLMEEATDLCVAMPSIIDSLAELGANPRYADIDGNTVLHYAACLPLAGASQDTVMKICQQLDDLGATAHAKNYQKETPLLFCLSRKGWMHKGNEITKLKILVEVCTFLLEQGSSLEETTQDERSIFHLIMELFDQCLHLHDDILRKEVLNKILALMHLFPSSHVTKGVTVNKRDGSLNSPLHMWAMLNFKFSARNKGSSKVDPYVFEKQILTEIFKHLVDCGAKLNDVNGMEQTPLHLCKTWTAAKLLIDAGAKTNILDSEGSSPLLVTIKRNQNVSDESDASCIYPDVLQKPEEFWKTVLKNKLDPWTVNKDGNSVMSILVESEGFVLAKALIDVACDGNYLQSDAIAVSLLNAICEDQSTRAQWKSILVDQILKSRKNTIHLRDGEDTPLHHCCRNIIRQMDGYSQIWRHNSQIVKDSFLSEITTSVHWTIVKQLLSHRFNCKIHDGSGQSCMDIAHKHPALEDLLKKQINISEVDIPVVIRWTSVSKTHKSTLAKVARQQECRQISSLWYHRNNIQKGSFGLVFVGINQKDGREVAIKRIEKLRMHRPEDKREITNLTKLADCEQVVRYLFFFEDVDFSYVVLELMEGNLYDYLGGTECDAKRTIRLCADVMKGLKYLHDQGIIHRDLKPSNILFKTFPQLCLKIADFGLSRCIDKCSTSATVCGSVAGTRCWIAPEVLKSSYKEHSMASDVFSCGLLLHYIQVKKHPFSPADCVDKNDLQINSATEDNILNDNMEGWDSSLCPEATELIKHMLNSDKGERPTAADGVTHPLFWPNKKKTDFLTSVGNQPEIQCPRAKRELPLTQVEIDLENCFGTIITKSSWTDSGYPNMSHIYAEMTKKRKLPYETFSVVELIRFIRNAYAHISEDKRPPSIRKLLLDDFVFLEYFPSLVVEVLKCVKKHGWDSLRDEIKYVLLDDTKTSKLKGCAEGIPEEPASMEND